MRKIISYIPFKGNEPAFKMMQTSNQSGTNRVFSIFLFIITTGDDGETKKKNGGNDEYMSHLVSFWWFRRTQCIPELGVDYKNVENLLGGCLTGGAI